MTGRADDEMSRGRPEGVDASTVRTARAVAGALALGDLIVVALTVALVRDVVVVSAAVFSALVAIAYLLRMMRGPFDPYGSISLLIWTVVSLTLFPGSVVAQGVCVFGMALVLLSCVLPRMAERRYVAFMTKVTSLQESVGRR